MLLNHLLVSYFYCFFIYELLLIDARTFSMLQDYIKESDNLVSLHDQIHDDDAILSQMETLLSGFQSEIGSINSDIKILQEKSMDMGLKLKNRKVWFLLGKFCIPENSAVILILMEAVMVVRERHPVLL
ncbi:vacuolar protein sorting-associated protein 52 A-like [Pistacia vera]|uniref:vacuolar protein sorting-associated protein 52 A-like n=1 Tax=Pistacia vera TaxID=55513 RepID=UPI0012637AD9|nr:vacuolar protein sorting-associated protein 52 A-like [Pistacia vera]